MRNFVLLSIPPTNASETHMPIHFETTAVVHGLLLLLELPHLFANSIALGNRAIALFALLSVNSKECPYSFANLATPHYFHLADAGVFEVVFHSSAI